MLKSVLTKLFCGAVALSVFVLSACSDSLTDKNDILLGMLAASNSKAVQYGSLTINSSDSRALNVSDISYVYASVSGTGIESPVTAKSETITDGSGSGSITITGIPAGKNRVVTVYAYDSSNQKLGTVMIRAVTDIEAGNKNSVTVNQSSTLLGNVFAELLAKGVNLASVEKTAVQSKISGATKNWSLYDASAIASDYASSSSVNGIKTISNYEVSTGSVTFTNYYDGCTIQVGDPVSSIKTSVSAGEGSISGIAPGTWPVYVTQNGKQVVKTYATVTAGGTYSLGNLGTVTDRIIVHAKDYLNIYIFDTTGVTTGHYAMIDEGNDWYVYVIDATRANLIFTKKLNGWDSQTADLSREAGEWWYKDGTWYEANPDDSEAPVLVSFTSDKSGTVSENVVLTVEATDNLNLSKAVLTIDGAALTTINLSGKTSTITYTWETAYIANGSHVIKAVVYDSANNASNEKTLSFTTSNANLPPVAKISGPKKMSPGKTLTYKGTDSYDQNGGTIASYKWTVTGAAATSSLTGETLTVTAPSTVGATFKVSLVVKDNEGASSETVSVDCETIDVDANWDFRDETIYFLMTTRFYDGNTGNNLYCWDEGGEYLKYGTGDCAWRGDFEGLIKKLDYIKALGFTTIWITPVVVNASGIDYHGYHAYDFSHVDPRYASGTPKYDANGDDISGDEAYQELIDAVHDKGMKIIQDIVLNHTGNWGEKNLNHLFDKGEAYVDSNGYKRSAPMIPNENSSVLKAAEAKVGYSSYEAAMAAKQEYQVRLKALKDDNIDPQLYHHEGSCEYNSISYVMGSMAGDCVDLNTENPTVQDYLIDCYTKYINMGVDGFRIDTVKHITRGVFNKVFNPAFHAAAAANGNDKFYMTGEVCARWNGRWSDNDIAQGAPSFYTWKDSTEDSYIRTLESNWTTAAHTAKTSYPYVFWDAHTNEKWISILDSIKPSICNARLNGNKYHEPDYTNFSGLNTIDFKMHWQFKETYNAFSAAKDFDEDICDASWQVVYVDSHDYAPDQAPQDNRFGGNWPDKLNLMFTFRGIPCIYYGTEIEFMKGYPIDPANARCALNASGRAYFGDHLEGTVTASDFGEYTADGTVATTLSHDLAQHIIRLNKIRAAIPALRKGQYSTEGCGGDGISFKRRYTKDGVDSFVLVAINGRGDFTGIPSGTYVEVITGKPVSSSGSLTTDSIGQDNMRVYVLQTGDGVEPTGKIGKDGAYLK